VAAGFTLEKGRRPERRKGRAYRVDRRMLGPEFVEVLVVEGSESVIVVSCYVCGVLINNGSVLQGSCLSESTRDLSEQKANLRHLG
jgi:hypothetical protein